MIKPHIYRAKHGSRTQWIAAYQSWYFAIGNTPFDAYLSLYHYLRGRPNKTEAENWFVMEAKRAIQRQHAAQITRRST